MKAKSQNEKWHWTKDEIGVVEKSWFWVQGEHMAWYLSWLERRNEIQWRWFQILLRPTFYSYLKESLSSEYHMYPLNPLR